MTRGVKPSIHPSRVRARTKRSTWSEIKVSLNQLDRVGLTAVIRDLYEASDLNRRFLHARFVQTSSALDQYRRLVRAAVFPDPLSQKPIRLRDAMATIREYTRATGDVTGTVDLLLEFVEAGTEQAADLGYGDDAYFASLERKVNETVRLLDTLPDPDRRARAKRLARLGAYQGTIGWGYCDFLAEVAAKVQGRVNRSARKHAPRGVSTQLGH